MVFIGDRLGVRVFRIGCKLGIGVDLGGVVVESTESVSELLVSLSS